VWSPQGAIDMHRPEMWVRPVHDGRPARDVPPRLRGPARHVLHRIYLRPARAPQGTWPLGAGADELRLPLLRDASFEGRPTVQATDHLFEASVAVRAPDGSDGGSTSARTRACG